MGHLIRLVDGYEQVVVYGFEGEASRTTAAGKMKVRLGTVREKKKAAKKGVFAEIRKRKEMEREGRYTEEKIREKSKEERKRAEREAVIYEAVKDEGRTTYVPNDSRMSRRKARDNKRTATEAAATDQPAVPSQPQQPPTPQPATQDEPVLPPPRKKPPLVIVDSDSD